MKRRRHRRLRVLALHPASANAAIFDDVAAETPALDLVAPDLVSITLAVGGRLGPLLRALAGIVPAGPVVLTGCGVGANVALELAALLGDRVQGVLLLDPQPLRPDPLYRNRNRHLARLVMAEMSVDEILAWVPLMVHRGSPRWKKTAPQAEAMLRASGGAACAPLVQVGADFPDGTLALRRLRAPVRAFFSGESINPFVGEGWISEWTRSLPQGATEVIPAARHWLPLEIPDRVAEALRSFTTVATTRPRAEGE